jgi:hypothetical protein
VEAREVERLLTQLEYGAGGVARVSAGRPRPPSAAVPPWAAPPSRASVWGRVAVGAALAVAMTQWPYAHACGFPLAGYLAAVAGVLVAGAWAAHGAWQARMGLAHLAALAIVFASAALAADQVMPRMGYSPVEVTWRCPG